MKNREKYHDLIMAMEFDCNSIRKYILKKDRCSQSLNCNGCRMRQMLWLDEEAEEEEEEVDWSKVKVDTPILVSSDNETWHKRYFAFAAYGGRTVYAFFDGQTSWSAYGNEEWEYAKLAEGEDE